MQIITIQFKDFTPITCGENEVMSEFYHIIIRKGSFHMVIKAHIYLDPAINHAVDFHLQDTCILQETEEEIEKCELLAQDELQFIHQFFEEYVFEVAIAD